MPRPAHFLDESLNAALAQPCTELPTPTARLLINLCGAIRGLERQLEANQHETLRLRTLLNLYGVDTALRSWEGPSLGSTGEMQPSEVAG